jgi:hypothetical protein
MARRDADGKVVRASTAGQLYDTVAADWYLDWRAGLADPMIATRNTVREELNRRARLLRQADGDLGGPVVAVRGREFAVGDVVVCRHNQRRLTTPDGWFVKNGSRGTITNLDPTAGTLTVGFDNPDGPARTVTLPAAYVQAHVEHGYAVTDYGVQGRTLTKAKAVLDDATTRSGAYVATTRGRRENRVYVVDGTLEPDPDTDHSLAAQVTGLDSITARLTADERDPLVHEHDPHAHPAARLARTLTLGQLGSLLDDVDARFALAPPDVTRWVTAAETELDRLRVERRMLADRITDRQRRGEHVPGLEHDLYTADTDIDRAAGRLYALQHRAVARVAWFAEHADLVDEHRLLRSAVQLREADIRQHAVTVGLPCLEPVDLEATTAQRHGWRHAVEQAALYRDRHDITDDGTLLGPPPTDPRALAAWRHTLDTYANTQPSPSAAIA